jgi:hypothetical protein
LGPPRATRSKSGRKSNTQQNNSSSPSPPPPTALGRIRAPKLLDNCGTRLAGSAGHQSFETRSGADASHSDRRQASQQEPDRVPRVYRDLTSNASNVVADRNLIAHVPFDISCLSLSLSLSLQTSLPLSPLLLSSTPAISNTSDNRAPLIHALLEMAHPDHSLLLSTSFASHSWSRVKRGTPECHDLPPHCWRPERGSYRNLGTQRKQ